EQGRLYPGGEDAVLYVLAGGNAVLDRLGSDELGAVEFAVLVRVGLVEGAHVALGLACFFARDIAVAVLVQLVEFRVVVQRPKRRGAGGQRDCNDAGQCMMAFHQKLLSGSEPRYLQQPCHSRVYWNINDLKRGGPAPAGAMCRSQATDIRDKLAHGINRGSP